MTVRHSNDPPEKNQMSHRKPQWTAIGSSRFPLQVIFISSFFLVVWQASYKIKNDKNILSSCSHLRQDINDVPPLVGDQMSGGR